jgi:SNF5 / SMARCB1 / INI1
LSKRGCSSNLIPIRLRLSVHGVRIHDDFDWDTAASALTSVLQMAQAIGSDLNLAPEAVQAVAIDIAEQIIAATAETTSKGNIPNTGTTTTTASGTVQNESNIEGDDGGPANRANLSAAWELPSDVHVTNVAHLVAHHRPPTGNSNSSATATKD